MSVSNSKILEVRDYLVNGDHNLGMRRLLDCVLDTGTARFYSQILGIYDQYDDDTLKMSQSAEVKTLLENLENFSFTQADTSSLLMKVTEVQKKYKAGNFKISPISFDLKYNQVIGLVGENGNGKTTLLRLLCQDLKVDNGSIWYNVEKNCKSAYELRSKLVYIPQRVPKWFGSLMDNLHFTIAMHGTTGVDNALLAEMIVARLGLRPYRHLNWNRISSGYRTRFELAKALMRQPEIMLLDEPLSNLDIISQQTILQDLKHMSGSFRNPFGIILSSQQLYEVEKISDMVIFLKNGEPKYQSQTIIEDPDSIEIIYELETEAGRDLIQNTFNAHGLKSIQYNGGVYVLVFENGTSSKTVFNAIAQNDLQVRYIRNISQSSRRFFIN